MVFVDNQSFLKIYSTFKLTQGITGTPTNFSDVLFFLIPNLV